MIVRPLTVEMVLEVADDLCARHREEVLRTWPDLATWARSRMRLNGASYGIVVEGRTLVIFGLAFEGSSGLLWLAGREGWTRYVKQLLRAWRAVRADASLLGLERFRCRVHADNPIAQRFVEHLGFNRSVPANGLIEYGMAA